MLQDKIRELLEAMRGEGGLSAVVYQNPSRANVDLSQAAAPMAVYFLTTDGSFDIATHIMRETARVQLAIITRAADMSVDGETNDRLLREVVRPLVVNFFARLRQERTLTAPDEVGYRVLYQYDDTNTTGYLLDFRVAEKIGECLT